MEKKPKRRTPHQRMTDAIDQTIKDHETIVGLIMSSRRAARMLMIAAEHFKDRNMHATAKLFHKEIETLAGDYSAAAKEHLPKADGIPF